MRQHPDCIAVDQRDPADCRITVVKTVIAASSWVPEFDGAGRVTNHDQRMHSLELTCSVCNRTWEQDMAPLPPQPPVIPPRREA